MEPCLTCVLELKSTVGPRKFKLLIAVSEDMWKVLCIVKGYHAYKEMWDSYLEDEFTTKYQLNATLTKAVVVLPMNIMKRIKVVGHLKYSRTVACLLTQRLHYWCCTCATPVME